MTSAISDLRLPSQLKIVITCSPLPNCTTTAWWQGQCSHLCEHVVTQPCTKSNLQRSDHKSSPRPTRILSKEVGPCSNQRVPLWQTPYDVTSCQQLSPPRWRGGCSDCTQLMTLLLERQKPRKCTQQQQQPNLLHQRKKTEGYWLTEVHLDDGDGGGGNCRVSDCRVTGRYGGVEAATFCALMTLYDALHHEACVDVYSVSKLYSMKRPGIWPTEVRPSLTRSSIQRLTVHVSLPYNSSITCLCLWLDTQFFCRRPSLKLSECGQVWQKNLRITGAVFHRPNAHPVRHPALWKHWRDVQLRKITRQPRSSLRHRFLNKTHHSLYATVRCQHASVSGRKCM